MAVILPSSAGPAGPSARFFRAAPALREDLWSCQAVWALARAVKVFPYKIKSQSPGSAGGILPRGTGVMVL